MYHQFKQLADIDITAGADGSRPDDALHHGRRARRRATRRCRPCPACSPRASARPASTAPTASAATRSPTSSCSASAPASTRRSSRKAQSGGAIDARQVDEAARRALEPFERGATGEGPYQVQYELQEMMQDLVGIVRNEAEMQRALDGLGELARARGARRRRRQPRVQPGWHTALDLHNLLTVSEAITRSALERKESRGGHFRDDYPDKDAGFGTFNLVVRKGARRRDGARRARRFREMPDELKQIIEEMK